MNTFSNKMKGKIMNINELCSILNVSDLHLTNESDINELYNAPGPNLGIHIIYCTRV